MKGDFEKHRHEAECRQTLRLWKGLIASVGKESADRWLKSHLSRIGSTRGEASRQMLEEGMRTCEQTALTAQVIPVVMGFALLYPWGEISVWKVETAGRYVPMISPGAFYKKGDTDRFYTEHRQGQLIAA